MRSQTYSRFVPSDQARERAPATDATTSTEARRLARRISRRLDTALAFLVVLAATWASWGVSSWLLAHWVIR